MLDARFIMNFTARRQAGEHVLNVIRSWYCHNGFTPLLVYCLLATTKLIQVIALPIEAAFDKHNIRTLKICI